MRVRRGGLVSSGATRSSWGARVGAPHEGGVGFPTEALVDELIELVEGEGAAVGAHGEALGRVDDLVEAVEGLGVGGGVAGDEGLLEELADGLGLELYDGGLEGLGVGAGG